MLLPYRGHHLGHPNNESLMNPWLLVLSCKREHPNSISISIGISGSMWSETLLPWEPSEVVGGCFTSQPPGNGCGWKIIKVGPQNKLVYNSCWEMRFSLEEKHCLLFFCENTMLKMKQEEKNGRHVSPARRTHIYIFKKKNHKNKTCMKPVWHCLAYVMFAWAFICSFLLYDVS